MPRLVTTASADGIEAGYEAQQKPRLWGSKPGLLESLAVPRPVFRGMLSDAIDETTLNGSFGVGWQARIAGLVSVVEVLAFVFAWAAGRPLDLTGIVGIAPIIPLVFVILSVITRINAMDDIPLLQKNLIYALDGE